MTSPSSGNPEPQAIQHYPHRASEEQYRDRWKWDKVFWGTHCVDCYPGNCPYHVFVKDDKVWLEEQAGHFTPTEEGIPDMNPMGCQKGASWSQTLYGQDRVLYPLRRAGERGEGKWQRISWDDALTEIADAMIDAIQEVGPESIIHMLGAEGGTWTFLGQGKLLALIGGLMTDVNAEINDFSPGLYTTFGKFNLCSSLDDAFHSELILVFQANPTYTVIASNHYLTEGRYHGSEVVLFAPDCSPSHMHVDYYVPTRTGTDAAWALAMCKVIIDENLYNAPFIKEQTDLPLLVRVDTRHFLRASDIEEDGSDEQFYLFDTNSQQIVEAPRTTLALGDVDPALEGSYSARLKDGRQVEVVPVFELLKERLQDYTPERAADICGTHADIIRLLARKIAKKRTGAWAGGTSLKYYHCDLMIRSITLLLGLTANWGKKGTGIGCWAAGLFDGPQIFGRKDRPGLEATKEVLEMHRRNLEFIKAEDPTLTDEMATIELSCRISRFAPQALMIPPAWLWYYHCGYRENWNKREWGDPTMARTFDEYMQEAVDKGWWEGTIRPAADRPPRVLLQAGGNTLRRVRGGKTMLLKHLWPKLKKVVTIDWRMSTTCLYSDIVLPCTNQYEVPRFHIPTPHMLMLIFSEKAAAPQGEAKTEWEISYLLAKKLEERARAKGLGEYQDSRGIVRRLEGLYDALTLGGEFEDEEKASAEMVRDTVESGTLPQGTTLDTLRQKGFIRFIDWGMSDMAITQAADIEPDQTFAHSRWNTEDKLPYPTLARRAQFYIDHDWFLEAGEELPTHKENPAMGGDYPFVMTSGHNRWSIHSINITNRLLLQTHRGQPHMVMNSDDARAKGIEDEEEVRVFNDMNSFIVPVKLSPSVRPGQVIVYNGWDPYQFREWNGPMDLEPGMVKWLHLAGGYGHLRYWPMQWQPTPYDRAVRVDVAKLD
ncbi:MAG: molybdopterin-dependent oxidoreductase [Chloroflexota bacterium]|nr:molybdopterin-dependent oxidoreductase [Chloroflexota bacterium]